MEKLKVSVMGLGNIGLPVAVYTHRFFSNTVGYDISERAIARALNNGIKASTTPELANVYIICVNTYYRNGIPDMGAIESCCRIISELNPEALVCFESTLAVGTARRMALKFGLSHVVVCPHRWWVEDEKNHGVKQLRVLGAFDEECMRQAEEFYDELKIPLHRVSSLEVAEATKIAENAHRYVEIAFAEELKLIAHKNGLDFDEWREAINTKWNCQLLEARDGIGKECLPKDTAFLASLSSDAELLRGAMKTDENYRQRFNKQPKAYYEEASLMNLAKRHSPQR